MLIVNDAHRLLAGAVSLNDPCPYCSQPLRSYPLIMSDDAAQTVYHAACAVELAEHPQQLRLLLQRHLLRHPFYFTSFQAPPSTLTIT